MRIPEYYCIIVYPTLFHFFVLAVSVAAVVYDKAKHVFDRTKRAVVSITLAIVTAIVISAATLGGSIGAAVITHNGEKALLDQSLDHERLMRETALNESRRRFNKQREVELLQLRDKLGLHEIDAARQSFLHFLRDGVTGHLGYDNIVQNVFNYLTDLNNVYGPEIQGLKKLDKNWNVFRTNISNCPSLPLSLSENFFDFNPENLPFCHITIEVGLFTTFNSERPSNLFQSNGQPFCSGCRYQNEDWGTPINESVKNIFRNRYSSKELNLVMFQDIPSTKYVPEWRRLSNLSITEKYPIGPTAKGSLISAEVYTKFLPIGNRGALNDVVHSIQGLPHDVLLLALGNKEIKTNNYDYSNLDWFETEYSFENRYPRP